MAKSRQQKRQEMRKVKKENNNLWIYALVAIVLTIIVGASVYLSTRPKTFTTSESGGSQTENIGPAITEYEEDEIPKEHVQAEFTMENGEKFTVELYPEYAPQTVANFVKLVSEGFYNDLSFHRVVEGFMAQGGYPHEADLGAVAKNIKGEFASNGFTQNTLSHQRGVISMARAEDPNSASSQFFICYGDASFLDGEYAAFGKVIEGMETIDNFLKIERVTNQLGEKAIPVTPIIIKSAVMK